MTCTHSTAYVRFTERDGSWVTLHYYCPICGATWTQSNYEPPTQVPEQPNWEPPKRH